MDYIRRQLEISREHYEDLVAEMGLSGTDQCEHFLDKMELMVSKKYAFFKLMRKKNSTGVLK